VRSLIIVGPGMKPHVNVDLIRESLHEDIAINSYPKDEGIAIFDCGKEPDYAWPDNTIVVGQCELGRHHADLEINETEDASSRIIETLSVLQESSPPSEETNAE